MKKGNPRPRIALLGMGVIGGGPLGQGIPAIKDLFLFLSSYYDIEFYSFKIVDLLQVPDSIRVRQPTRWRVPGRAKYMIVAIRLILNHLRNHYDLVFGITAFPTGQYAVILSRIIRRPVIVQFIDLETVCLPDIGLGNLCKPWLKKITIWVSENATALIMVADYQKKIALESIPISRHIDVLPLRIIPQDFQFIERQITFPVQFIHVAYYSPIKDQNTMFRAFAEVSQKIDCRLTIVGSGFDIPEIQTMMYDLKITDKVIFTGALPYSQIPKQFQHAHILLHTARFETGCAVIQEAMASGVAVCGTRVGILADLGERFGVIVSPKDDVQLASKILMLIEDPASYKRIIHEAHQWINKYDAAWASENYRLFIDSMLAKVQSKKSQTKTSGAL